MPKAPRNTGRHPFDDAIVAAKRRKIAPHEFVLDALASVAPTTRPMFGCLAVYVEEQIVLILRDRHDSPRDNGVWLATTAEHHESLRREFPGMRSIQLFGRKVTHWQVLAVDLPRFEETVLSKLRAHSCARSAHRQSSEKAGDFEAAPRAFMR